MYLACGKYYVTLAGPFSVPDAKPMIVEWFQPKFRAACTWIDEHTGGAFSVLWLAYNRFNRVRGAEAAASIGYYALFSLFPILLLLVAALSFVLLSVPDPDQVMSYVNRVVPFTLPQQLIEENLVLILETRTTTTIIGLAGLIWAASGVFLTLTRNINRAWPLAAPRNFIQGRLLAILIILAILLLVILSILLTTALSLFSRFNIPIGGSISIYDTPFYQALQRLVPWFFTFSIFMPLYWWIPNTKVLWKEAFWGALSASTGWQMLSIAFGWYLSSGVVNFELIYGSLGALVGLMLWIYLSSMITLFGAHVSAALASLTRLRSVQKDLDDDLPCD